MYAKFRPNPHGGWYYRLIDEHGESYGEHYVSSYRKARRKARKLAWKLEKAASVREHVVDLDSGQEVRTYPRPQRTPERTSYDPNKTIWVTPTGMDEKGRVSIRLQDVKDALDDEA